ncbi:hypothetical protein CYMTET_43728 [Cymbomonas tetramitiformis]|uniref:Uncharacterized protein n=1 Tax=Cymbomonas tetramitiformis TaxID=36881 RepID=A0AAE0C1L4_9CHLO|nr:hypothetical protein CYMTET_43728 [Cymbomonas tetramitiformis]
MLQYGRLLCNVDTGIIFCMFTICSGVGLLFINNTDFIADALYECSPDSSNKSTIACHRSRQLVDLFGWLIPLVSCGTRIFVGTVSDRLQKPFWSYEYKRHARSTYCKGTSCYSTTFELAFGVSIVALGMSLYVARKFRQVGQYI